MATPPGPPPQGWTPEGRYYSPDGGPPPLAPPIAPPPYTGRGVAVPMIPPPRPDFEFPPGVMPAFGGYQPEPPQPAGPGPAPPPKDPPKPRRLPGVHRNAGSVGVGPGMHYLYPDKHTTLHVIVDDTNPVEKPNTAFQFTPLRVPCSMTVKELIHQLGARAGPDDKNGVTEVMENGIGRWEKGASIFKNQDAAKQTLEKLGWNEHRGQPPRKPVWIVVSRGS